MNKSSAGGQVDAGELLNRLLSAAHAEEDALEARLASVGLSRAKLKILTMLAEAREALPLRELADRSRCVRSNVTQLVDRLEADGLVRRVDDPDDRRSVRAVLTPEGRDRQARGQLLQSARESEFAARFSAEERQALAGLLGSMP